MMNFGDPRAPARLWEKCTPVMPSGCWRWNGAIAGGPQIRMKGRTIQVKRLLFELAHGPTDQPCVGGCSEDCVNPDHQVAGTTQELTAAYHARHPLPPTCRHGHVRAVVGVYVYQRDERTFRMCRACHSIAMAMRHARLRKRRIRRMSPSRRAAFTRRSRAQATRWKHRPRVPLATATCGT